MKTKWLILILTGFLVTSFLVVNRVREFHHERLEVAKRIYEVQNTRLIDQEEVEQISKIVYDGMTLEELGAKLERSLNSTLSGYGMLFASYSLELGIDPYLAVAIVLHETGCRWGCSYLVKACNNVGGQVASPSCNGGIYKSYPTLEQGIKGYMDNLYRNYYAYGLTTPETIGPKYAASKTWPTKVSKYIEQIKNK